MNVLGYLNVVPRLPTRIQRLQELADNLYWTWQPDARQLFRDLDRSVWLASNHDPIVVLREVSQERLEAAARDADFVAAYDDVIERFDAYQARPSWYQEHLTSSGVGGAEGRLHAYFCAEYGWHESVQLYSGGLGVLAGDHTKAASDLGVPLIAVGLYYPEGYFHQRVAADGRQEAVYVRTTPTDMPFTPVLDSDGERAVVEVETFGRTVRIQAWQVDVGRVKVLLLDVDHEDNSAEDRALLSRLYGGDQRTRVAQEMLLGIGGVRLLRRLGLAPTSWHMNEGHSAFMALERCRELVASGREFAAAREVVAADTVFTVHTPVAAGNDAFGFELMDQAFRDYHRGLGISREEFLQLGSADHGWGEVFSMPALAIRFSSGRNGVAELHGETSRRIWADLWPGVPLEEVPIGHVTNGVHLATWMAPAMQSLVARTVGGGWQSVVADESTWQRFSEVDPAEYWEVRKALKRQSLRFLRRRLERQLTRQEASPTALLGSSAIFDPEALTIGFARRFAAYKRATLIFRDLDRLHAILADPHRPVQLVFAGKAHPADQQGQELIASIHRLSHDERFAGRVLFVEDYDMAVGRALTRGVDVWLNNPRRPLEASGTSGQKAALNGVLNLSILDGWWPEAYAGDNGWAIGSGRSYADEERADASDADSLYALLEGEVVPLFYDRDRPPGADAGAEPLPLEWLRRSVAAVASVTPAFNAQRMVKDYVTRYYLPASVRGEQMNADGGALAEELAAWRERVAELWPGVRLKDATLSEQALESGEEVEATVALVAPGFEAGEVVVELVYSAADDALQSGLETVRLARPEAGAGSKGAGGVYRARFSPRLSGRLAFGIRCYPAHRGLVAQADARAVSWAAG